MIMMMISMTIAMLIPIMVMMITNILSKKMINDREKSSPFECGFDPKSSARMPFSLQFFMIAVIFLIFDVEIVMILPIMLMFKSSMIMTLFMPTLFFIMILLMGLYHEWKQGALQWAT
uniref:NADH dehydrogenase subunit 3 n=1 Tax=Phytomastax pentaspinula TaxID=3034359 RepID=UPI0024110275|nr:NADH dehydrogenase subunit 3 [Phytomastax pentaspinula]WEL32814.1 NADH dehydrogenase subunit 3 [Phytomastax pentaspinula]